MDARNIKIGANELVIGKQEFAMVTRFQRMMDTFLGKCGIHDIKINDGVFEIHSDEDIPERVMEKIKDFSRPYVTTQIRSGERTYNWPTL